MGNSIDHGLQIRAGDLPSRYASFPTPAGARFVGTGLGASSQGCSRASPKERPRPIINLRRQNAHLQVQHFKMENILCLRDLLKKDDYMIKLDLQDAYLTILIHVSDRRLFRFLCQGKAFQFHSLPFGLATTPRAFTKSSSGSSDHLFG